jgi:hypothetical protein
MTAGIIAATLLITATTIDDSVWLIPYCTSPHLSYCTKIIHGATFVATLESLAILCVVLSKIFQDILLKEGGNDVDESFILGLAGAVICWAIAIGLYVKKWLKRKRRRAENVIVEETLRLTEENEVEEANAVERDGEYSSAVEETLSDGDHSSDTSSNGRNIPSTPSIKMIVSLTILGALDEISYFPALLVGKVFTPVELCLGTGIATAIILVVVLAFLSKVKPLVDFLDGIPLYGIVGMFAVILTVGLFW